jgi:hypothetical protein
MVASPLTSDDGTKRHHCNWYEELEKNLPKRDSIQDASYCLDQLEMGCHDC